VITEAIEIIFYLFLVVGEGIMVGVLAILLIILIATFGAWLAIQISSFKKRSQQET
jgi:hypothetical protein